MHLSSCLLAVTVFAGAPVSAFYPYQFEVPKKDGQGLLSSGPVRRFFPYAPFSEEKGDGVPKLDIKKGPKSSLVRRENKFEAEMGSPPSKEDSMTINNDGHDYTYFAIVEFGSEGQEMWMLLDSGAAKTWVMGTNCTSEACSAHNTFGEEDSNTISFTEEKWDVAYGSGSVNGVIVNDTMSFAGFELDLAFGSASEASKDFLNYPMDGIFGLGLADDSDTDSPPTVMQEIMNRKLLKNNIVGINLQRASDDATDGQITFGDADTSKYSGELVYADTLPDIHRWEISVEDMIIDGKPAGFTGKTAVIDTGTSYILMPSGDAKKFHDMIPDSEQSGETFKIPCSSTTTVEVVISGTKFTVPPKDYVGSADGTGESCNSNVAGHKPFGDDQWLLGDVFLKNTYTVLDFDQRRIGFGKRTYGEEPTSTQGIFNSSPAPTSTTDPTGTGTGTGTALPEEANSAAGTLHVPVPFAIASCLAICISWLASNL